MPDVTVKVTVTSEDGKEHYTVDAAVTGHGYWKALLKPTAAGGSYTVSAACTSGCEHGGAAVLKDVTFGEVWYCAGQSNMWTRPDPPSH